MDHSGMDHGHMGHGDMDMGDGDSPMCSMNVMLSDTCLRSRSPADTDNVYR